MRSPADLFPTQGTAPGPRSYGVTNPVPIASRPQAPDSTIPLVRLDNQDPALFEELMAAIERIAGRAAFTLGDEVEAFEQEFAAFCDARAAVGVSSGTDALALALRASGIGPGDEVIVPANYVHRDRRGGHARRRHGSLRRCGRVDPASSRPRPSSRTSGLVPAASCPCTCTAARSISIRFSRWRRPKACEVIEDACQAHGARYGGRPVGAIGRCGAISFYPAKNLGGWATAAPW